MFAHLTEHELFYYSTVALVIPVLLLALAVEARPSLWLNPPRSTFAAWTVRVIAFVVAIYMFSAEVVAIDGLREDSVDSSASVWTMLAVLVGLIGVMYGVITRMLKDVNSLSDAGQSDAVHDGQNEQDPEL